LTTCRKAKIGEGPRRRHLSKTTLRPARGGPRMGTGRDNEKTTTYILKTQAWGAALVERGKTKKSLGKEPEKKH